LHTNGGMVGLDVGAVMENVTEGFDPD